MPQQQVFATKGNLIKAKQSLRQAQLGYELMDRKRNILIREMVALTILSFFHRRLATKCEQPFFIYWFWFLGHPFHLWDRDK